MYYGFEFARCQVGVPRASRLKRVSVHSSRSSLLGDFRIASPERIECPVASFVAPGSGFYASKVLVRQKALQSAKVLDCPNVLQQLCMF